MPLCATHLRALVCVCATVLVTAYNAADRLRTGMPEREVLTIMGQPTRTVDDAARFREELTGEPKCAAGARRILVFNVSARRRVRVVLDSNAAVACVIKSEDMMY